MSVGCVIVTYNPNIDLLQNVIDSVLSQADKIFISDNSTQNFNGKCVLNDSKIVYVKHGFNLGIAAAQNVGIEYFNSLKYTHVILLDQDSVMPNGLVKTLYSDLEYLLVKGIIVGGIGPKIINKDGLSEYKKSIVVHSDFKNNFIVEVSELMSSATLIPLLNFENIGLFDENLFIDGVDHEWCWRASHKGKYRFFISSKTKLYHKLGEGDKFFVFKKISIPTPIRTFYQYRNYINLLSRNYVPLKWKVLNGIKYFVKYFYYPLFVSPRIDYFRFINKGIFQGVISLIKKV